MIRTFSTFPLSLYFWTGNLGNVLCNTTECPNWSPVKSAQKFSLFMALSKSCTKIPPSLCGKIPPLCVKKSPSLCGKIPHCVPRKLFLTVAANDVLEFMIFVHPEINCSLFGEIFWFFTVGKKIGNLEFLIFHLGKKIEIFNFSLWGEKIGLDLDTLVGRNWKFHF